MSLLESTFNCQNCSKRLWIKYYKLLDGKIVCPKCYFDYIKGKEMDELMIRKKESEI